MTNLDELKREVVTANKDVHYDMFSDHLRWVIDYLAERGHLTQRQSLPNIPRLPVALKNAMGVSYEPDRAECAIWCGSKESAEAVLKAAQEYCKFMEKNDV